MFGEDIETKWSQSRSQKCLSINLRCLSFSNQSPITNHHGFPIPDMLRFFFLPIHELIWLNFMESISWSKYVQSSHGSLSKWMVRTVDALEICVHQLVGSLSHCLQGLYRFPGNSRSQKCCSKNLAFDRRPYRHGFLPFSVAEFGRTGSPWQSDFFQWRIRKIKQKGRLWGRHVGPLKIYTVLRQSCQNFCTYFGGRMSFFKYGLLN